MVAARILAAADINKAPEPESLTPGNEALFTKNNVLFHNFYCLACSVGILAYHDAYALAALLMRRPERSKYSVATTSLLLFSTLLMAVVDLPVMVMFLQDPLK